MAMFCITGTSYIMAPWINRQEMNADRELCLLEKSRFYRHSDNVRRWHERWADYNIGVQDFQPPQLPYCSCQDFVPSYVIID